MTNWILQLYDRYVQLFGDPDEPARARPDAPPTAAPSTPAEQRASN